MNIATNRAHRQMLGKRMGLTPYYSIAENTASRLILRSQPGANARAGYIFAGCGSILTLISISLFCLGYTSSMDDFSAFFSSMLLSWPCGVVGGLGVIGGLAIAKTINTITIDTNERTIIYSQKARRERTQMLDFDQIAYLRMSTQAFYPPRFVRRLHTIAVLECITDEQHAWLIDSASDVEAIEPVADALCQILAVELRREQPILPLSKASGNL
jgi:hypothetical protein